MTDNKTNEMPLMDVKPKVITSDAPPTPSTSAASGAFKAIHPESFIIKAPSAEQSKK